MVLPTKTSSEITSETMESVLLDGDLSKLKPDQRVHYYQKVCESLGLNPLTKPLEYIRLNGKLTLYAKRDCADQLRAIHGVSIEIVSQEVSDGIITIHARARMPDGRTDEDLGVVPLLKGEAQANQKKKAITQAKRRVTLSICGLGFLDETEVGTVATDYQSSEAIKTDQVAEINKLIGEIDVVLNLDDDERKKLVERFLASVGVGAIEDIPAVKFDDVIYNLNKKKAQAITKSKEPAAP